MKAWAVIRPREPLACVDLPDPEPTGTEVVVQVSHCGLCHSDLHFWHGGYDLGGGRFLSLADRGIVLPAAPGHEIVGRVIRIGPDATGVAVGDARIVYPWLGCGTCRRCVAGEDNLCAQQRSLGVVQSGGFASEVKVPHPRYLFAFEGIDPALAATYACSGLTAYGAARKALPADPEEPVVVIGAGGLGLAAISVLRALGHRAIVAVDRDAGKLDGAREAGASGAVVAEGPETAARLRAEAGAPIQAVLDFVGVDASAALGHEVVAKGGTLVLVGVHGGELKLSVAGSVFRALRVQGSLTGSLREMAEVIELARSGRLKPTPVATLPIAEVNAVMTALERGEIAGRAVLAH